MPETIYAVEMAWDFNRTVTDWEAENIACDALREVDTQPMAAWMDGYNWLEADGTEVGWADWPPGGAQ